MPLLATGPLLRHTSRRDDVAGPFALSEGRTDPIRPRPRRRAEGVPHETGK